MELEFRQLEEKVRKDIATLLTTDRADINIKTGDYAIFRVDYDNTSADIPLSIVLYHNVIDYLNRSRKNREELPEELKNSVPITIHQGKKVGDEVSWDGGRDLFVNFCPQRVTLLEVLDADTSIPLYIREIGKYPSVIQAIDDISPETFLDTLKQPAKFTHEHIVGKRPSRI
ncbi:MAG: hypothetical protein Q7S88_01100 [Candidatus Daviesbacteria bacterium]|nr:hypothetical protein [Candidatus Daviesbacteria bacterium]